MAFYKLQKMVSQTWLRQYTEDNFLPFLLRHKKNTFIVHVLDHFTVNYSQCCLTAFSDKYPE